MMKPIAEGVAVVDEEEGSLDSFSNVGAPPTSPQQRRPLQGLDRELSTKFGPTSPTAGEINDNNSTNSSGRQAGPSFTDFLQAQKKLQSRRRLSQTDLLLQRSASNTSDTSIGSSRRLYGSDIGTNIAVASAVAKLRAKAAEQQQQTSLTNQGTQPLPTSTAKQSAYTSNKQITSFGWDEIFTELQNIDEDGHFLDHHTHIVPWYSPPIQRQRWGEDSVLPHVNWGDLFFDLFYVAMAYNLGVMLTTAMNSEYWLRGIIFYIGSFGPLWNSWETSMQFESRFTTVDYYHRLFEVVRYLFVSTAIVHVKSVQLFSDPSSTETILFICAILGEILMHLGLNVEILLKAQGDKEAIRNHTLANIKQLIPTILIYLSAAITAGMQFQEKQQEDTSNSSRLLEADTVIVGAYAASEDESEQLWTLSDLPLTLMAIGYVFNIASTVLSAWCLTNKYGDIRKCMVPYNVDYVIHRYGEWTLLMIGEGILSLLIVETAEVKDYYLITTFGVLTVILIQVLKFESEPHNADNHALWRSPSSAACYMYLLELLSMALIVFGVTYKVFLKDVVRVSSAYYGSEYDYGKATRRLGTTPVITQEASAAVFSGALGVVILTLEVMMWTHSAIKKSFENLIHHTSNGKKKPRYAVICTQLLKVAIILFTVTLSRWTVEPETLTICGCGAVLGVAVVRILTYFLVHRSEVLDNITTKMRDTVGRANQAISNTSERVAQRTSVISSSTADKEAGESEVDVSAHSTVSKTPSLAVKRATPRLSSNGEDTVGIDSFDAIIVANLDGIMTQVNDTAVSMFGYASKQELIGKNLSIIVGGGDCMRHAGYVSAFKKRVETHENAQHKVLGRQRMLQGVQADGTEFPCIIGIKMVSNGTRVAGYIRDMSGVLSNEKKKVTNTMENSKDALLRSVVDDHAFDAVVATDDRGIIQKVNQTALDEFGYDTKDELVGEKLSVLIHNITPKQLSESHGKQRVVSLTKKDGKEFQSVVASKKIKGSDDMFVSYIRNIDSFKHSIKLD